MSNTVTQTQEFFHSYAGDFNAIYSSGNGLVTNLVNRTFRKSMRLRYLKTLEGCQPVQGRTVLDVGCGPGHYGIALARGGAREVIGLDFAGGMIEIARKQADAVGVADRCRFQTGDFHAFAPAEQMDYVIVMGFMDYMEHPKSVIDHALSLTRRKAFFSFPVSGGILAWQRKMRYRSRCPLYLYSHADVERLFGGIRGAEVKIEPIARDYFVTVEKG